jgi:ABC-type uncharacterized transport system substrate-binding protein
MFAGRRRIPTDVPASMSPAYSKLKPGDLPGQLPTKFELVINLTTAKSLGLDIPFHLPQRADVLIE